VLKLAGSDGEAAGDMQACTWSDGIMFWAALSLLSVGGLPGVPVAHMQSASTCCVSTGSVTT
jgi:hypothetical protein